MSLVDLFNEAFYHIKGIMTFPIKLLYFTCELILVKEND